MRIRGQKLMAWLKLGGDERRRMSAMMRFAMENLGAMFYENMILCRFQVGKQSRFEMNARQPGQDCSSPESSVSEPEHCPAQEAENSFQHTMCNTMSQAGG